MKQVSAMQKRVFLPQQIVPVDPRQAALTDGLLAAAGGALTDWFLALRLEADAALAPRLRSVAGKAYPYGRCEEITRDVFMRMAARIKQPTLCEINLFLHNFVVGNGDVRTVWGVQEERYFQNAIQIGALYVDVAGDTVVITDPKVEILPIFDCGLAHVRDIAHFRRTAQAYWNADIYINDCAPSLAPVLPMICAGSGHFRPSLQSACDYMLALMMRDAFLDAETWLRNGPAPPPEIADALMTTIPADLRPVAGTDRRRQALAACRAARKSGGHRSLDWRAARVGDFLRIGPPDVAGSAENFKSYAIGQGHA
jgi:hypothetical protein